MTRKKSPDGEHPDEPLEVAFAHARWRHFFWAAALGTIGVLLAVRLVGVWKGLGLLVLAMGLSSAYSFLRTLLHPAGAILVRGQDVVLSPRLCAKGTLTMRVADVHHAYLLRRSLAWSTGGQVLVLETHQGTFRYPRDWFANDEDQRRLFHVLNAKLGRV